MSRPKPTVLMTGQDGYMPGGEMRAAIAELKSRLQKASYTSEVRGRRISELYRDREALLQAQYRGSSNGEMPYRSVGLGNELRITALSYAAGVGAFFRKLFK